MAARKSLCPVLPCGPARCRKNRVIFRHMTNSFARSSAAAVGALLAVATIPFLLLLTKAQWEQFAAMILAAMGAIYIGFGLQKSNRAQIATELTVGTGFFTAALAALLVTPWIVPVAYVARWSLGLCAPPRFKAFIRTLKARRHTLMVSFILRRLRLGGRRRPWR
jgi:hypothetical protein